MFVSESSPMEPLSVRFFLIPMLRLFDQSLYFAISARSLLKFGEPLIESLNRHQITQLDRLQSQVRPIVPFLFQLFLQQNFLLNIRAKTLLHEFELGLAHSSVNHVCIDPIQARQMVRVHVRTLSSQVGYQEFLVNNLHQRPKIDRILIIDCLASSLSQNAQLLFVRF